MEVGGVRSVSVALRKITRAQDRTLVFSCGNAIRYLLDKIFF